MRIPLAAVLTTSLASVVVLQAQPRVQTFTLPNGLRVLHLEDHEHPLVRARLHLSLRPADLPPGRQGLPELALRMFAHSEAGDLKAERFDRLLDDSGIQMTQTADGEGLDWRIVARSRDQDRALGLLADRLQRTVFDPSDLEIQRLACWRQVDRPADSPHAQLERLLRRDPASTPTLTSLGAIAWEDLLTFRALVFRPDRAVLVLHGDLGLEQAKRLVLLSLGTWTPQEPPKRTEPAAPATPSSAITAPPASPSRISVIGTGLRVQALAPRPDGLSPEAAWLLARLVPGDGLLFPVRISAEPGGLLATLDADTSATSTHAWALLHLRLEALRRRGFTQGDLDRARSAWAETRHLDSLHPEAQMDAALAEATGRGVSAERMAALNLEALNAALRSWLDPAQLRSGVSGDPELMKTLVRP
ncbi:hypothetical protein GETHLI_14060 [Geothrix limicola]|uniref:Peptidase M16 C-terminal domain-containing protein n=1 Tax=Geothrix limicola TaxID=2927978 RepID=A0ABQ5QE88_9BACT|nr:insulinase family protein [Geothrix limicola]GLH72904.1 hypothetical protein GETHLI_14060 [Geothrix limicola]